MHARVVSGGASQTAELKKRAGESVEPEKIHTVVISTRTVEGDPHEGVPTGLTRIAKIIIQIAEESLTAADTTTNVLKIEFSLQTCSHARALAFCHVGLEPRTSRKHFKWCYSMDLEKPRIGFPTRQAHAGTPILVSVATDQLEKPPLQSMRSGATKKSETAGVTSCSSKCKFQLIVLPPQISNSASIPASSHRGARVFSDPTCFRSSTDHFAPCPRETAPRAASIARAWVRVMRRGEEDQNTAKT